MQEKLKRPKEKNNKVVNFRLKEKEWEDLRRCAIVSGLTMVDWLRMSVQEYKKKAIKAGTWTEKTERD